MYTSDGLINEIKTLFFVNEMLTATKWQRLYSFGERYTCTMTKSFSLDLTVWYACVNYIRVRLDSHEYEWTIAIINIVNIHIYWKDSISIFIKNSTQFFFSIEII